MTKIIGESLMPHDQTYIESLGLGEHIQELEAQIAQNIDDVHATQTEYHPKTVAQESLYDVQPVQKRKREFTNTKESRVTLDDLREACGFSDTWIHGVLNAAGISGYEEQLPNQERQVSYPLLALQSIYEAAHKRPKYGGDWCTVSRILRESEAPKSLIMGILEKYTPEMRQDDNGIARVHYPPEAVKEISRIHQQT